MTSIIPRPLGRGYLSPVADNILGVYLPDGTVKTSLPDFGMSTAGRIKIA
jgi:hypothetical protein